MARSLHDDAVPFSVEVWPEGGRPRVLGRAATLTLAHAVYTAALESYPGARILLKRGAEVFRDSAALSS
jgi:hypothetical protein